MKTALICGVSGQDGAYLAKLLLEKGYRVFGTSRDAQVANFANLDRLSIRDHIELESMALTDFRSTLQTIAKAKPDEVYNLSGQSSVALSFQQPVETMDSISVGTLNLLEAVRFLTKKIVCAACRIRGGRQNAVKLGNLGIKRDWGWAPEYVEAMWRILQH